MTAFTDQIESAIEANDLSRLRSLFERKADVNVENEEGQTPLMIAS